MGAETSAVKKKHEWNPIAGEEEWMENTEIWKAKGKAMDTNTGESPGYHSLSQSPRNSPSEEVTRYWTPTGTEPMDQWVEWN